MHTWHLHIVGGYGSFKNEEEVRMSQFSADESIYLVQDPMSAQETVCWESNPRFANKRVYVTSNSALADRRVYFTHRPNASTKKVYVVNPEALPSWFRRFSGD